MRGSILVLALGVGGFAGEAAACLDIGDPCQDVDTWTVVEPLSAAKLPIDGMILMRVSGPSQAPVPLDVMTIEVTVDGAPVAGALEQTGIDGLLGWRPAAPLMPESTYVVAGTIHNLDFRPGIPSCGEEFVPFEFEAATGSGTMAPLVPPEASAEETAEVGEKLVIDNLVCCDGAFPTTWSGCGSSGMVIVDEGHCVPLHWTGVLKVRLLAQVTGDESASMLTAALVVDGVNVIDEVAVLEPSFQMFASGPGPFCSEVVLRNLVTGETAAGPKLCHGEALADQLGAQMLTLESPALAVCAGAPYVCELDEFGESWDPDRCTTWPAGEGTTGDPGPTSGGPTSGGPTDPGGTTGGSSGTTGESATSPADNGLVEHGCACASGGAGISACWGLLVLAGWRRARRRGE